MVEIFPKKKSEYKKLLLYVFYFIIVIISDIATSICLYALGPDEILVVANQNVPGSVELAKYYMTKRGIAEENLLILRVIDKEKCSRREYEKKIAQPVRKYLKSKTQIKCLLTMFGLPLKVASPEMTWVEQKEIINLKADKKEFEKRLLKSKSGSDTRSIENELAEVIRKIKVFKFRYDKGASLDSELSLVKQKSYSLSMWVSNPYFADSIGKRLQFVKSDVVMVCRLDAPTYRDVKRVIDDSLYAEKNGLKGKAYFDARWSDPGKKELKSYAYYDRSIHLAAEKVAKKTFMPVVTDDSNQLFQAGQCPEAALYCGWYKLAEYIDAFTWQKGSVGYHIASAECTTLKNKKSRVWCKMMLVKGIAATIGPVDEPYVQAFPVPDLFFGLLTMGEMTLVEYYFASTPFLSWKMVLIGDPLYNPFRK